LAALNYDKYILGDIPMEERTQEMCDLVWKATHGSALKIKDVPPQFLRPEWCMSYVKQNGNMLMSIPEQMRTYPICMAAVEDYGEALNFVPVKFRTQELCDVAMLRPIRPDWREPRLNSVPVEHRTYDMCMNSVQQDARSLQFVPDKFKDIPMCSAALKTDRKEAIKHMSKEMYAEVQGSDEAEFQARVKRMRDQETAQQADNSNSLTQINKPTSNL
jgi:hypothetical protein